MSPLTTLVSGSSCGGVIAPSKSSRWPRQSCRGVVGEIEECRPRKVWNAREETTQRFGHMTGARFLTISSEDCRSKNPAKRRRGVDVRAAPRLASFNGVVGEEKGSSNFGDGSSSDDREIDEIELAGSLARGFQYQKQKSGSTGIFLATASCSLARLHAALRDDERILLHRSHFSSHAFCVSMVGVNRFRISEQEQACT